MATPVMVTDGVDDFEAAVANKAIQSDGTKTTVKMYHARINWDGANPQVVGAVDSSGVVTGDLTFDGGPTEFTITIAGFTNPPVVTMSPSTTGAYNVKLSLQSNVLLRVAFFDAAGAQIATGVGDNNMDFNIMIIGE